MAEALQRRHGLEPFLNEAPTASADAGVEIRIRHDLGHINLRGNADDADFVRRASKALGEDLPLVANTMTLDKHQVYWLGPDEWLIVTAIDKTQKLVERLRKTLSGSNSAAVDISGGLIAFRISGPNVREVFAKGCTLDFHPDVFKSGACAQSGLAKATVLFGHADDQSRFDVIVRRSFSDYLVRWLKQAGSEYGVDFRAE